MSYRVNRRTVGALLLGSVAMATTVSAEPAMMRAVRIDTVKMVKK